jgi:hypothetical protein
MSDFENGDIKQEIKPRGRAAWQTIYEEWRASGQSRTAFCQKRQLSSSAFNYWCGQFLKEERESKFQEISFQTVPTLPFAATAKASNDPRIAEIFDSRLTVALNSGIQLHIPRKVEAKVLEYVLHLLTQQKKHD